MGLRSKCSGWGSYSARSLVLVLGTAVLCWERGIPLGERVALVKNALHETLLHAAAATAVPVPAARVSGIFIGSILHY